MISADILKEKTQIASQNNDLETIQEIFMTLPNKKRAMTDKEYNIHIKDLFTFITHCQKNNQKLYDNLIKLPLFDKINKEIIKDFSKFNIKIEKKFTQAVTDEYEKTVQNLAEIIKNPDFLNLFKEKNKSIKWLENLNGLHNKDLIKQIIIDLSQSSVAFKLEKTGEYTGFLLGEATFAYQIYENSPTLQKLYKTRQSYLLKVMEETTMVVQFSYKNPTDRHSCIFNNFSVASSVEHYKNNDHKIKEKSTIDALSVSPTRKTIIPFISISSRTMSDSLSTQSEQASRFLTHINEHSVKKQIIAKALKIDLEQVTENEISQWKIEPQIMDIAPIDEWGKSRRGQKNSTILLGNAAGKNLGNPSQEIFNISKTNYRRELNHITYLATLFSGVINDTLEKRKEFGGSTSLIQANYWSIGVDTHEIYNIGECIKDSASEQKRFKLLHLYCAQKLSLLIEGLEQAPHFEEVLPEASLTKINQILTVYHALCGSHGANCSNPIHKKNFPEFTKNENVQGLYQIGNRLIKWIENFPGGINTNLELYKEVKSLKLLVGKSQDEFKKNMIEFTPAEYKPSRLKRKV